MNLSKITTIIFSLILSASAMSAGKNQITQESQALINNLREKIRGTLSVVAENERLAGNEMGDFYYSLEFPAQQVSNLGLVLDVENAAEGYKVLSVSPGSTADELAIKSGDLVLSINDIEVGEASSELAIKTLQNIVPGQEIHLALESDGTTKKLSAKIDSLYIPSVRMEIGSNGSENDFENLKQHSEMKACGEISTFFNPPVTQFIYPAKINKVNDDTAKRNRHSLRLPVGKHTIYLHEYINDPFYTIRRSGLQKAKPIEIEIKANTTYYLGAKFIKENRNKTRKGEYWTPVIWKSVESDCQL